MADYYAEAARILQGVLEHKGNLALLQSDDLKPSLSETVRGSQVALIRGRC